MVDVLEVRQDLEAMAASIAAQKATDEQKEDLNNCCPADVCSAFADEVYKMAIITAALA